MKTGVEFSPRIFAERLRGVKDELAGRVGFEKRRSALARPRRN
jgi:hypothetical protein